MAITMTKVGNLPAQKWYTGRCNTCESEYRAQQKDLTYECDFRESFYTSKCQLEGCNETVYFVVER